MVLERLDGTFFQKQPVFSPCIHPLPEYRVRLIDNDISFDMGTITTHSTRPGHIWRIPYRGVDDSKQNHQSTGHLSDHIIHYHLFLQHRVLLRGTRREPTRQNLLGRFRLGTDECHHRGFEHLRGHEDRANPCRGSRCRGYDILPHLHGIRDNKIPK